MSIFFMFSFDIGSGRSNNRVNKVYENFNSGSRKAKKE